MVSATTTISELKSEFRSFHLINYDRLECVPTGRARLRVVSWPPPTLSSAMGLSRRKVSHIAIGKRRHNQSSSSCHFINEKC